MKNNLELEKSARHLNCKRMITIQNDEFRLGMNYVNLCNEILDWFLFLVHVDTDAVKESWLESEGQFQIKSIAQHYGIYEHLFGYAYFVPRIRLDIKVKSLYHFFSFHPWIPYHSLLNTIYECLNIKIILICLLFLKYAVSEDTYAPVYYGNTLKPTHAKNAPEVSFDAKKKLIDDEVHRRFKPVVFVVVYNFTFFYYFPFEDRIWQSMDSSFNQPRWPFHRKW